MPFVMPLECITPIFGLSWRNVSSFHFFLSFSSSAEWHLTHSLNDLQKRFINLAELSYNRVSGMIVKVSLTVSSLEEKEKIFYKLLNGTSTCIKISLPLYLLSCKDKIILSIEKVSSWNNTKIEYFIGKKEFTISLFGLTEQVYKTRLEIFKIIEEFIGSTSTAISGVVSANDIISNGARIYFESRIFCKNAIVSGNLDKLFINARTESKPPYKAIIRVDLIKLTYCMIYSRQILEEILARNESYLDEIIENTQYTNVSVISQNKRSLDSAVTEIELMFTQVVEVKLEKTVPYHLAEVFILTLPESVLVIGAITEVKKLLREIDYSCLLCLKFFTAIEEFVCGKKNGKTNKIAKESDCQITLKKEHETLLVIEGKAINLEFALSLIEDELPTEYSFYLHEKHHKRIIGYGGKSIQRLMKKHAVYIKFQSGPHLENNVMIRTPRKNKESLYKMYKDVMELAGETPLLSSGVWSILSHSDFYAHSFLIYKLGHSQMEVFSEDLVNVNYYLVPLSSKDKYQTICMLENKLVVSSILPIPEGELLTGDAWDKVDPVSEYINKGYTKIILGKEPIWSDRLKQVSFGAWYNPWSTNRNYP
ncbi:hypothetical protein NEOKW01_0422 [Nematocida sp. AWRm80]|nr:hypothetical protein NEOKW01_0422 [Nematocida sp. AWRm80]